MSKYEYELCGSYELQVNKSLIKCSKKVIESSKLWLDMVDFTEPKDDSPITIPSFISEQIILDLVEMVEKGDMKCNHLGKLLITPPCRCLNVVNVFSSYFTLVPTPVPDCG